MMMMAAAFMLASCDIDNDNSTPERYGDKLANTQWQLAEVMNENREWQSAESFAELAIPELWFGKNDYRMRITSIEFRNAIVSVAGTYSIDKYNNINMSVDNHVGTAYVIYISYLNDHTLEGRLTIYGETHATLSPDGNGVSFSTDSRQYSIRLMKTK